MAIQGFKCIAPFVKALRADFGPLCGLVNNAGLGSVEFLLGDGGRNVTGTTLTIDAGNTA